jgi:hypothetical protein
VDHKLWQDVMFFNLQSNFSGKQQERRSKKKVLGLNLLTNIIRRNWPTSFIYETKKRFGCIS